MNIILEIKNQENGEWELFPILTVKAQDFRGGLRTAVSPGSVLEMRFVNLNGDSNTFIEGEFCGRINSIRLLDESDYYLLCGEVVNGQDVWERLSEGLLR